MKYYTFKKVALKAKASWQKLRFTRGKGYWLFGKRPVVVTKMYDAVNVSNIPVKAQAVAGYVNGHWPTYPEIVKKWPNAKHLSIAVTSHADAECLDVEQGDATNAVAPDWVRRQLDRGVKKPVVYTSVSNARALLRELERAGITRGQVRLWTAHYTFKSHLCSSKCGFGDVQADATQWTDRSGGKSLDESLLSPKFFT